MNMNQNHIIVFFFSSFFLLSGSMLSQNLNTWSEIGVSHNWIYLGRDIEIGYTQYFGKNGIKIGINHFENLPLPETRFDNEAFFKRGRANTLKEKLGFNIGYQRLIRFNDSNLELHPFANVQFYKVGLHTVNREIDPFQTIDYTVGLIGKVRVYKNLYLHGGAKVGFMIYAADKYYGIVSGGNNLESNLSHGANVGLSYRIGKS